MKKLIIIQLIWLTTTVFAQSKEAGTEQEVIKQYARRPQFDFVHKDEEAVRSVLSKYKSAIEKLDVSRTEMLFATDAKIYVSGTSNGNYVYYLEHHFAPELRELKAFKFDSYITEIQVDGNYAFATEQYNYTIVILKDNSERKGKGLTTSVFKKMKGEWKITISHKS